MGGVVNCVEQSVLEIENGKPMQNRWKSDVLNN